MTLPVHDHWRVRRAVAAGAEIVERRYGDPHTEQLHVVERFSRPNLMTLHYQATIEDPGAYTRPWTIAFDVNWVPNGETDCQVPMRQLICS
jgi:hypothetical protein